MAAVFEEIYSLLVPIAGGRLVLPRAAIVEVMGFNKPKERPEDAPDWLMGWIPWQGARIPLVSFEAASGQPLPEFKNRTRIAVVQAIGGVLDPPAFALATQGYPYLLRVNRRVLRLDDSGEELPSQMLARVRMANERPGIPDLEALERMIADALGIQPPEPVAEAVEVTPEEPTSIGTTSMSLERSGLQLPDDVADEIRIDDDLDLEAVLDEATAEAAREADGTAATDASEEGLISDEEITIEGLEVDDGEPPAG